MAPSRIRGFVLIALLLASFSTAFAQTSPTSIQLTWTAPGDDGTVGTASQYELRYSTATITASNFSSATPWTSMPAPTAAGSSQNVTVTGLSPATTYYFAIKTADNAGNWSTISNVVSKTTPSAPDLVRPAPIAVNVGSITDTTVTLNWTAVGDDSLTGTATSYDVRFSTFPITASNWSTTAAATGEPAPAVAGTAQSFVVRNLQRDAAYYFAIRVSDDAGNTSAISNVPSASTTDKMPPAAILNLTANFWWLSWQSASALRPRGIEGR